ncbi:uncharacterized protein LOC119089389 [Pollicipes pollicipes]|uniref:uncharacterized protein LOC119089389 n=1 Tax=Pollicipes pollicipes TaxID=41117 RepID=UPI0018857D72|nr:uncharacterized protein LOC119089389 [Pollicipes pollicipes]
MCTRAAALNEDFYGRQRARRPPAARGSDSASRAGGSASRLRVGPTPVEARGENKALRNALRMRALSDLVAKPHQARMMDCVASQPVSSHYMYNGSFTRFAEWRFVHRARLGLVPLNGYRRGAGDRRCRRCGYAKETLPHVFNHCRPHSAALQRRHNAILARLEKAVPLFAGTDVLVNRRVPGTESALRPDLAVTRGAHIPLVDVTVSFENRLAALRAAGDEKVAKYAGLVAELRRQGKHASVHALVIGPLGTWYRGNEETLRHLRVSRVYARLMRKLIPTEASRLQRLYRANRGKAMRDVLAEESPSCPLQPAVIREHFAPPNRAADPFEWDAHPECVEEPVEALPTAELSRYFEADEVWRRMSAASTAPGADGLRYVAWRALDPGALLLTRAFNLCARHRRVPAAWKESSTILLHKGGDVREPSNWRPIALMNTIAKVYAGLWADRLSRWAETENLLSCQQKGFRSYDGVLEHNFILQSAITAQRRQPGGQLHVCFIDLANAFGSLPHRYLWSVLARLGLPGEVLFTLEDLCDGSTTTYTTAQGTSEPAPVTRGVRQGCPLSGILFNLGMEPLVRALDAADGVTTLAFADDLALLCRDAEALDTALTTLEEVCIWCGLALNARKSGLLSVGSPSPQVRLMGQPIPVIGERCSCRYLGRPVGHTRLSCPPLQVLAEAEQAAHLVLDSALAPWQKLDVLRAFILPRLTHCLRLGLLPKQALRRFDAELRWRVKGALQLPSRACQEHLHASTSRGCVGLTELASEADILLLASTWQLLTSPDKLVRETAASQLQESARKRLLAEPTPAQLGDYLNGREMRDGGDVSTRFSRTCVATKALAKTIPVAWRAMDGELRLAVGDDVVPRREAAALLREAVRQAAAERLYRLPHQGKVMQTVGDQRVSSHYMYSGSFTRFAEWRFVHRARLGLVPLNGVRRSRVRGDERCRRCGYARETLPLVLCRCMPHSAAFQRRHNAILSRLHKAVQRDGVVTQIIRRVPGCASTLGPDLVVTRGDEVILAGVTVTFENGATRPRCAGSASAGTTPS